MGWLGRKRRPHEEEEEEQPRTSRNPLAPLPPVLNILVPDIAGVTSFHIRQFYDTDDACDFIQALPSTAGLHAFWGMHAPPAGHVCGEGASEAMVLIRSAESSDTVYVVSFVDLESADAFARFEAKRGMNLGLFLIYWAEIVDIQVGEDGISLAPDTPPPPGVSARRFAPEPVTRAAVQPPAPVVESPVEAPALAPAVPEQAAEWAFVSEPTAEVVASEPAPVAGELVRPETAIQAAPAGPAAEPVVHAEPAVALPLAPAPSEPEMVAPPPIEVAAELPPVAPGAQPSFPADAAVTNDDEMDIEREASEFLRASSNGARAPQEPETWHPVEVPPAYSAETDPEEQVAARNGQPVEPVFSRADEIAGLSAPLRQWDTESADPESAEEAENSEHRVQEVEKILNVKRWDKKDSPFRGFDSPPGRF